MEKGAGVCSNKYGSYDRNEIALIAIGIKKNWYHLNKAGKV